MYRRVIKKSFGFAVQTKWKIKELEDRFGILADKVVYWPNGTDVERFKLNISKEQARTKLNLIQKQGIVLYTGQLFGWKGVDTLIKAVNLVNESANIYIVGGNDKDVKMLKREIPEANNKRIRFISFQPHDLIPTWLRAADVLILPNTAKQKVSCYYTSPMKMFEYMASGRPIVASNTPSILEILNNKNALFAEADNPNSFGEKINYVLDNPEKVLVLWERAQEEVEKYTWKNRARKIISHFERLLTNK